jgi:hypothetical protein
MSRFYVGQRVRIKWSSDHPELNGTLGTIRCAAFVVPHASRGTYIGHEVVTDLWGSSTPPDDPRATFAPAVDQLEPLTDSYDVTSWDTCVWRPEHLRVGA